MSGLKHDEGKLDWYALPLEILEPLAELMLSGEQKYGTFNCLEHFENSNRRFWSANMRHASKCQQDPLAIDEETGCYHEAARAFCSLMRIYHAKREKSGSGEKIVVRWHVGKGERLKYLDILSYGDLEERLKGGI